MWGVKWNQVDWSKKIKKTWIKKYTNNWCWIRTTHQTTHKLRITWFIKMPETTKYQISQLSAAQEVELGLYTNNWCSIRTTHQTTHKLRITLFKWMLETTKYQISQ